MRRVVMTAHVLLFPVLVALGVGCSGSVAPHETARDDPKPDREAADVSADAPTSPPPAPSANERAARVEDDGPDVTASPASFSLATYNVNWGNVDLPAMVDTIRRADADVVCLQENTPPSERVIRETFAEHYPQIRFQGDRGRYAAEGFGILSRVPITKIGYVPPKHGLFGAYLAQVQLGGRTVQVVNVHLQPPPMLRRADGVLGTLKALTDMQETQVREMVHLLERIPPDVPTILAGDFNSPSTLRAPMLLKGKGYVDGFAQANEDPDSYASWHWPTMFGEVSLRIDYIFHTRDLRTVASEVIRSGASDHFPVVSRLAWSEEREAASQR